jgi:hypothetical protein
MQRDKTKINNEVNEHLYMSLFIGILADVEQLSLVSADYPITRALVAVNKQNL